MFLPMIIIQGDINDNQSKFRFNDGKKRSIAD